MLSKYAHAALAFLRALWAKEPVRVSIWTATAIVLIAGRLGVVLPQLTVLNDVEIVLPILLGGEAARRVVTSPETLARLLPPTVAARITAYTGTGVTAPSNTGTAATAPKDAA